MRQHVAQALEEMGTDMNRIIFHLFPTNDAWCRDHGPAYLLNRDNPGQHAIVNWNHNAWGGKYPPFDLDDVIPTKIAKHFNLPLFTPAIVMEGGSVEFNGAGTILTSEACLLNENRNPHLNREQIETYLKEFYGAEQILWVGDGIIGDDTDGHIDTLARFAPGGIILYNGCDDPEDEHFEPLMKMEQELKSLTDADGNHYHLIKLPMPDAIYDEISRLPATYANFLIMNHQVLVPVYGQPENDVKACQLIGEAFPGRKIVAIDCRALICQHGSLHCATMQLPKGSLTNH
jgi:agmatine deiminase